MKEEIGITETKSGNFSEWYTQVVIKAQLADYAPVKGTIVLRPDGYSIWESLQSALNEQFARAGIRNAFLPVLIPESLLNKEKSHFQGFNPEVFWVTHSGDSHVGDRLALRPTSETIAYSLYSKWIKSWRDLPLKLNFWNTALRAEIKATKPFLRNSEFLWQEGHTAHATREEAVSQVSQMLNIYRHVVETYLAIPVEEGQKSQSEQFVGADYTLTIEAIMPDGKALQMGTSHLLGQNFSRPFSVKFADKDNIEHYAWQTSWGVSWRLIGAMIMVHSDDRGLVLPPKVAPRQVVIVPIYTSGNDNVMQEAQALTYALSNHGIRVHLDDREQITPGFKFHDWEMRGIPLRLEIGPRDVRNKQAVMVRRDSGAKESIPLSEAADRVAATLDTMQSDMLTSARRRASEMTFDVDGYDSVGRRVQSGGFMRAHWCGDSMCEKAIKDDTGAEIRLKYNDDTGSTCIRCGKDANNAVLLARGY